MPPLQDVHTLFLRTHEYIRIHASGIKLANQMTGDGEITLDYLGGPNARVLLSRTGRQKTASQREDSMRRTLPNVAGFEDGEMEPHAKERRHLLEVEKGNGISPRAFTRNTALPKP